jgi:flagellar assembly factor FliW
MAIHIESSRFGNLELADEQRVRFPLGLIGIAGSDYAFVDPSEGSAFRWLHSLEDGSFAIPVVDPRLVLAEFELAVGAEERQRVGVEDLFAASVYVTVRASSDPADTTLNLRAPIVIWRGRGHQVINTAEGASLRAPLPIRALTAA